MLIKSDPAIISDYFEDTSVLKGGFADQVYLPENITEVSHLLRELNQKQYPLTISGSRTGTTGGAIPFGGSVLSLEKFNRIKNIDKGKRLVTVEPFVTLADLFSALIKEDLIYPVDPTETTASIGGTIATNASGARSFYYQATRNWVEALKVVLASGDILELKRGVLKAPNFNFCSQALKIKNAAGYYLREDMDLIDLFIGSEGTLGVIVEVTLKVIDLWPSLLALIAFFEKEELALDFISEAKRTSGAMALEFFDHNSLSLLREKYSHIPKDAQAAIFLEEGCSLEKREQVLDFWVALLEKYKVDLETTWMADDLEKEKEIKEFRHALPEILGELFKKYGQQKVSLDIAVPAHNFSQMFSFYKENLSKSDLLYVIFGHIGDSHLHVNIIPKTETERERAKDLSLACLKKAIELQGTVSAEHGIGKIKRDYLRLMYDDDSLTCMAKVKKYYDPHLILNRGNIFTEENLA